MGETRRVKPKGTRKIRKIMREFGSGTLRSSSGEKVTDPKRAKAIALNSQRSADMETGKRKRGRGKTKKSRKAN